MHFADHGREGFAEAEGPCILPLVASTSVPRASRSRHSISASRLTDVVRSAAVQLRQRLDRLAESLRDPQPGRIAAILDGDRLRHLAAEVDSISRTLSQLGDLVSPDAASARWVSPRGVLEAVLASLQRPAGAATTRVALDVAEGHAIHADPALIRRVLETLLVNAIEAAGPRGEVVVTSVEYADAIEIEVADSGPGLSGHAKAWLFEPGFTTTADGAGVALPSASSLVEQLGGTIDAIDCPEGGAAFTVRLPHGRRRMAA